MVSARNIPSVEDMSANIIALYRECGRVEPTILSTGPLWYPAANRDARAIADIAGITVLQSSDVISVLCPQKFWIDNVRDARAVVEQYASTGGCDRATIRAYMPGGIGQFSTDRQFAECYAILSAGDRVTGRKRIDFADSIADPESMLECPVIDQHACRIAIADGEDKGTFPATRYDQFVAAYVMAARILGIAPQHLQATTWEYWRIRPRHASGRQHYAVAAYNRDRGYIAR